MKKFSIEIMSNAGLRSKSAALLVHLASKYNARIWIEKESKKVDAKSIMGVMSLGVAQGEQVTFYIDGHDEEAAAEAIKATIISDFSKPV